MEASKIIADFRREADDRVEPFFASNEDCLEWLSEAEREAAIRGRLLFEHVEPSMCEIQIIPGQSRYALDPRWFAVEAVTLERALGNDLTPLQPVNTLQYKMAYRDGPSYPPVPNLPWWFFKDGHRLSAFSVDGNTLTVMPTPDATFGNGLNPGILRLAGYRLPLYDIETLEDEPEIHAVHHDGLVQWMLYRFYSMGDQEIQDATKAGTAFNLFEARFGPRPTAVQIRNQTERRAWRTKINRYP